jgi:hypothetical protein
VLFFVASRGVEATRSERHRRARSRFERTVPKTASRPPNTRLINAGIATINDMKTLRACVAYENAHEQRVQILRRLDDRASELRADDT